MAYRFKEPGHGPEGMRGGDNNRMLGSMDDKRMSEEMGDFNRGPRASFGRGRSHSDKPFMDRQRDFGGFSRDDRPMRERSPIQGGFDDRYPDRDRFARNDMSYPARDKDNSRSYMDEREIFRDKFQEGRFSQMSGFGPRFDDDRRLGSANFQNVPPKGGYKNDLIKPNECEIIAVNKQQRAYAECIEARMKNLGILVDILFLKDEALLVQTIDDIARRGSLYAMVITPLNETHRSVTLNILFGAAQEHRNMPLDDALKLVARNFHDHIRKQREVMDRDRSERGAFFGSFPADQEIQFLLRLLADGRQVSLGELDTVIKYFKERREKMTGASSETIQTPSAAPIASIPSENIPQKGEVDLVKKEHDLQNRIMNIMNQGPQNSENAQAINTGPATDRQSNMGVLSHSTSSNISHGGQGSGLDSSANQPNTSSTYINFDNPSVQKALDNLMQSGPNLLKTLTTGANPPNINSDSKQHGALGSQRGASSDLNEMGRGGLGMAQGRNVPSDVKNMGMMDSRNSGVMDNTRNMGANPRMSQNMGSGHMPNMGNRGSFQEIPGIFGSGSGGMGNRPPFMNMGGPMNNQGRRF